MNIKKTTLGKLFTNTLLGMTLVSTIAQANDNLNTNTNNVNLTEINQSSDSVNNKQNIIKDNIIEVKVQTLDMKINSIKDNYKSEVAQLDTSHEGNIKAYNIEYKKNIQNIYKSDMTIPEMADAQQKLSEEHFMKINNEQMIYFELKTEIDTKLYDSKQTLLNEVEQQKFKDFDQIITKSEIIKINDQLSPQKIIPIQYNLSDKEMSQGYINMPNDTNFALQDSKDNFFNNLANEDYVGDKQPKSFSQEDADKWNKALGYVEGDEMFAIATEVPDIEPEDSFLDM